jgi:nitroimidazol reductase NimA-like FMN-containing flavoprotein (pyridoxamine 5'-phosphate oxidase superfamily)
MSKPATHCPGLKTPRTRLKRLPKRGAHDFATIAAILDAGFVGHVGFVSGGQPYVIPTGYGRRDRVLYIHGSAASRMLSQAAKGVPVCVTVTLVDGLVLARSAFHSSVNYRSVVILGTAEPVADQDKAAALKTISDHIVPGRWESLRAVRQEELDQTLVLKLDIVEATAKIRSGPPVDDEEDYSLPIWAGTLDFVPLTATPNPDRRLAAGVPVPQQALRYRRIKT